MIIFLLIHYYGFVIIHEEMTNVHLLLHLTIQYNGGNRECFYDLEKKEGIETPILLQRICFYPFFPNY